MCAVKSHADSKQALVEGSISVFAEKGFEGATVKDIADEAGVNVALINYYFGGKEGLYKAVLETAVKTRIDVVDRVLKPVDSAEEFKVRLKVFLEDFIVCHSENPKLMKIIHRDFDGQHPIALDVFRDIFQQMNKKVTSFIESSRKSGLLRKNLDSACFVSVLIGSLIHSLRIDFLRKDIVGIR